MHPSVMQLLISFIYLWSCLFTCLLILTYFLLGLAGSSLCSEDSGHLRRNGSLYGDLGAMTEYYKIVKGPPAADY